MFDQLFATAHERLRPGATVVAETARAYAEMILASLDRIERGIVDDEWIETRRRFTVPVAAGSIAYEAFTVPASERWELESVASSLATPGSFALFEAPNVSTGTVFNPAGKAIRWGAAGTSNVQSMTGSNVIFEGNTKIFAAGVGTTDGILNIQVKVKRHNPKYEARHAGGDPERVSQLPIVRNSTERHVTVDMHEGISPVGARAAQR